MIEKYDYRAEMKKDIYNFLEDNEYLIINISETKETTDFDALYDEVYEEILLSDEVTGGFSEKYYYSDSEARKALENNNDLILLAEFKNAIDLDNEKPTYIDYIIRKTLASEILTQVLEEIKTTD